MLFCPMMAVRSPCPACLLACLAEPEVTNPRPHHNPPSIHTAGKLASTCLHACMPAYSCEVWCVWSCVWVAWVACVSV